MTGTSTKVKESIICFSLAGSATWPRYGAGAVWAREAPPVKSSCPFPCPFGGSNDSFGASKSIGWTLPPRWGFWCIQGARAEWREFPKSATNRDAEGCCFLHSMWSLLTADWPGCWKSKETFAFWHLENGYALVELYKWLCGREKWIATW